MSDPERDVHRDEHPRGPGPLLRQARERRQVGIPEVAAALHLEQRTLEALEADDYSALPPVTFVRGYLRSYARYLRLSEEEVLQAFDRLGLNKRRPLTTSVGAVDRSEPGIDVGTVLLAGLLVVVVLGGGWLVWSGRLSLPSPAPDDDLPAVASAAAEAPSPEPAAAPAESSAAAARGPAPDAGNMASGGASAVAGERVMEGDAAPAEDQSVAAGPEPEADAVPAAGGEGDLISGDGESAGATDLPAADGAGERPDEAEQLAAAATTGAVPATEPATPPESFQTLSFTFTGESWMEVVDARGERLLFGLVTEPGERVVHGLPPFEIVIGDVTQVSMRRGGQPVAVDSYTRGRVARFTLGEPQDQ